jgi:hypothetical protein
MGDLSGGIEVVFGLVLLAGAVVGAMVGAATVWWWFS